MPDIRKLLTVQEHDTRIRDMERAIRDIPARKQQEETRLEEHKAELGEAEEALKATQAEIKKLELEIQSWKDKVAKLRQQQLEIKTNKEFRAIETEIQTAAEAIRGLEDQELERMETLELGRRDVGAKQKALDEEKTAVAEDVAALDQRLRQIETDVALEREAREGAVGEVDAPDWLQTYERILSRKDKALVPIEGGVCSGCHMKLLPYIVHDAKKASELVACSFCGRLLYEG